MSSFFIGTSDADKFDDVTEFQRFAMDNNSAEVAELAEMIWELGFESCTAIDRLLSFDPKGFATVFNLQTEVYEDRAKLSCLTSFVTTHSSEYNCIRVTVFPYVQHSRRDGTLFFRLIVFWGSLCAELYDLKFVLGERLPEPHVGVKTPPTSQFDPERGEHPSAVRLWEHFVETVESHTAEKKPTKPRFLKHPSALNSVWPFPLHVCLGCLQWL